MPHLAPTARDTVLRDGTAQLYRFRRSSPAEANVPVLLVPSMINQWYVLDLREKASLARALTLAGIDTFCLDWGGAEDEDRYLTWDDVLARLRRAVRRVKRLTGAPRVGLLGYCMGGTLAGIYGALRPDDVAGLVNLAGPFDFLRAGLLGRMVERRWFDPKAVAPAGNVSPQQMQGGFLALRPTQQISKWIGFADRAWDPQARESFEALEAWASDNVAFPAAAYVTYIEDLYQKNALVRGEHHVWGERVDLQNVKCPVLTIAAERDAICPQEAARGLNEACGSKDTELMVVPGGHVGAVVGSRAPKVLYPAISRFFTTKLGATAPKQSEETACN